jgi:methylglutaconyl-CoA hydratase
MDNYRTIIPKITGQVATLWLARPEVHNALNNNMILELTDFFTRIEENNEIRIIVFRGQGKSFCSGADLQWMKSSFALSPDENKKECKRLTGLFEQIFSSSKVVIGVIHGNTFGGGNGLVAVCDLAYCLNETRFSLSETRIGMAAASITPFLLNKVAASKLKELIFTASGFDGYEAESNGLVNQSFSKMDELETHLQKTTRAILANGKNGIIESKQLINRLIIGSMANEMEKIPELLARIRVSPEAQEGFSAFLEKRKPNW